MKKPEDMVFGNFRIDKKGHIEFYVGWCGLDYDDIKNLKRVLAEKELIKLNELENKR